MSYQDEPTSIELQARRQPLETAAALQLGLMLFAFSRLDLHLRLLVEDLGGLPQPADSFQERLHWLDIASQGLTDAALASACAAWISRAQAAGATHGALLRGHWLPDLRRGVVLHVAAGPGQPVTTDYTVSDLEGLHRGLHELQDELQGFAAGERQLRAAMAAP